MKKVIKTLTAAMLITSMMSTACLAATTTLDKNTTSGSTTVTVDTTAIDNDGGSLPNSFSYKVKIPAKMILKATNDFEVLAATETFKASADVVVTGVATKGKHIKISASSGNGEDSDCAITLTASDSSKKTNGGTFYLGSSGNHEYLIDDPSDTTAMLSTSGLKIPLSISGVQGITTFETFTGSINFTISEQAI